MKFKLSNNLNETPMSIVTVKPKFQVTIPAKLRKGIDLREGDFLEATLVGNGILFKPKALIDRDSTADRIDARFAATQPSTADLGRSEDEIMKDAINDVSRSRRERRGRLG